MKQVTLLFLLKDDQILLAMKKRGHGVGKWNGVGGKVDPNESILEGTVRECREEIGVTPRDITPAGRIKFTVKGGDEVIEHDCSIFTASAWEGEPVESEEMQPQWFKIADIPYTAMWPDDNLWLPHVIAGELFEATITTTTEEVLEHDVRIVASL